MFRAASIAALIVVSLGGRMLHGECWLICHHHHSRTDRHADSCHESAVGQITLSSGAHRCADQAPPDALIAGPTANQPAAAIQPATRSENAAAPAASRLIRAAGETTSPSPPPRTHSPLRI